MMILVDRISLLQRPCRLAINWLQNRTDARQSWDECPDGSWLLWVATRPKLAKACPLHIAVVRAAVACGRTSLEFAGEYRAVCEAAYDAAEQWCNNPNDVTRKSEAAAAEEAARAAEEAAAAAWAAAAQNADLVRSIVPFDLVAEAWGLEVEE